MPPGTHTKGGILDLIITNSPDYIQNLYIDHTLFSLSDHFPICFTVLSVLPHLRPPGTKFLNYSKADFEGMRDFLMDWDFTPCLNSNDVDFIWSHIKSAIYAAIPGADLGGGFVGLQPPQNIQNQKIIFNF